MSLEGKTIGVALTGSFCTYEKVFVGIQSLVDEGALVQTIFSDASSSIDSRFGRAEAFIERAEAITGVHPMMTISEAEPIGPGSLLDIPVPATRSPNWQTASPIPLS